MAKPTKEKEKKPEDIFLQNALCVEKIKKEERCQKLYTEFTINPFKKMHVLPDKPMSRKMYEDVEEDPTFLEKIRRAHLEPTKKYTRPMTESQEIGWISTPLIALARTDRRMDFRRHKTDITKHMEAAWRLKEQTQNLK